MRRHHLAIFFFLTIACGCQLKTARHNDLAIKKTTVEFFKEVFVEKNFDSAYSMLDEEFKKVMSKDKFKQIILRAHSGRRPKELSVYEYEIYGGQETISTISKKLDYEPQLFYRLTLKGSPSTGYKIFAFFIDKDEIEVKGNRQPFTEKAVLKIKRN